MGNSGSSLPSTLVVQGHVLRIKGPVGEQPTASKGSSGGGSSSGGGGPSVVVYMAEDDARRKFAVQVTRVPVENARGNAQAAKELAEHARLPPHPHLVAFVASKVESEGAHTLYYLVTEHCPRTVRGMMDGAAKRKEPLHEREILNIFTSAASAVTHLHAHGVAHRDVRVETLLFGAVDGHVKLGALGSCSTEHRRIRGGTEAGAAREEVERATTPACRAPEQVDLFSGKVVGERVDVWALGVLLYQLCWWRTPFEDAGSPQGVSTMAILSARYKAPLVAGGLPPYSPGVLVLLKELLEPDPDRRPTAHQVLLRVRELMREGEIGFFTDLPALGGGGRHSDAGGLGAGGEHEEDLLGIHSLPAAPLASAVLPTTQQPSPMSVAHEPLALSLSLSSVSASRSAKGGGGGAGGLGAKGKQPMPPPIVITPGKGHHKGKGSGGVVDLSASVSASLAGAGSSGGYKENGGKGGMGRRSLSFARLAALGSGNGAAGAGAEGEGGGEDWRDDRGLDWTMGAGDLAVSAAASTRRRGSSGGSSAAPAGRGRGGGVDLSELATVNLALPRSSSASSLSALYDEHGRVRSASKTAVGALWQRRLSSFMGGGGGSGEKGKRSWVVKATSREPGQPKAKYVRKIVLAVWERQMSSSTFFIHLYQRPVLSHPVVALKGLITTLKLLQQGPRGFLAECAPCVGLLDEMGRHWGAVLGKVATDPTREQLTRSSTAEGYTSVVPHLVPVVGAGANGYGGQGCCVLGASGSSAAAISATAAANANAAAVSASPSHKRQHLDAASIDLLARLARLLVAKLSFHEQHPAFATHFTAIPTMLGYETVPVAGGDSTTEDLKALSRLLTLQEAILHTGRLAFAAKNEGVAATARWLLLPLIEEGYTVLVACTFLLASLLERSARAAAGLPLPATAAAAVTPGTPATPSRRVSAASASGRGASSSSSSSSSSTGLAEWRQRVTALLALREQYEGQLAQLRALYADGERVEEVRAMKRVPLLPLSVPVALDGALNWKPATMRSPMRGVFGLGLDRARMEEEQGAVEGEEEEETPRTAVTSTVALSVSGRASGGMPITAHALARLDNGDLPLSSSSGHGRSSLAFAPAPAPPLSCHSSSSSSAPPPRVPPLLSVQNPAASAAVAALSSMATWESFADTAGLSNPGAAPDQQQQKNGARQQQRSGAQRRGSSLGVLASSGPKPAVPAAPSAATALLASTQRQQQQPLASSVADEQARSEGADSTGGGWFLPSSVQAAVASTLGSSNGVQPLLASSAAAEPIGAAAAAAAPAPATPGRAARAGTQSSTVEGFLQTTAQLDGTLVLPVVSPPHHSHHHHHHHHHPAPGSLPPRMSIAGVPLGGAEGQAMLAKADSRDLLEWSSSSSEEEDEEEDDLTGTTGTVAALNTENMSRIIGVGAGVGGSAVIMGGLQTVDGVGPEGEEQPPPPQQQQQDGDGEGESKRAPEDQQEQPPPPPPSQPPPAAAVDPAQQQAAVAAQEKQSRARRREARAQPWRAHMKPAVALALSGLLRELEAHAASLVPTDDIVWGETIGHGAFATVYRAYCRGQDVAVKKLVTQNNLPMVEKSVRDFASEVSLLRMLRHPNVIAFVGACADPVAVLTEYCHKGNLFMVLNEKARYRDIIWARKLSVARGLADGMHYLHTREPILIHRDLKSLNVLLTRDWVVKITDFGLSRFKPHSLSDIMTMQCGTYHWMAPEVINSTKYTERADVYSFGIILWEIYTRAIPYDGMQPVQVVAAVINRGERPPLPADCPQAYADLVRACWAHEPAERPSFSEIVERLRALPE